MDKYKKVVANTGIFFLGTFGSRLLSFFLVRFYTELLSTEQYGLIDVISTTAHLIVPIVTLSITEAVLRFSVDENSDRGRIYTSGLFVILLGNLLFLLTVPVFMQIKAYEGYLVYLYILILSDSFYRVTAHFARGSGKPKLFATSGILHTFLQISMNIAFLLFLKLGIFGYLLSMILSNFLTTVFLLFFGKVYRNIIFKIDFPYLKTMLKYSVPIIPNTILWWITASSDRYVIMAVLGLGMNGIYTAASKIPNLITNLGTVFLNAWQLSSAEEANSENRSTFYNNVMQVGASFLFLVSSFIMVIIQPLYRVFVDEAYYDGWQVVPLLTLSMFFSTMSGFIGTNYFAMKKTGGVFYTTILSAAVNVLLNLLLTPAIGIRGTALATAVSFALTWIIRSFATRKFVKIEYKIKTFVLPFAILLIQTILLTIGVRSILYQAILFLLVVLLSLDVVKSVVLKGLNMIRKKQN